MIVQEGNELPRVLFIADERLSRERTLILMRVLGELRRSLNVETLSGNPDEELTLKKLAQTNYRLVIAPWYLYLKWSKVEAHFGNTRSEGPSFAGYFAEPVNLSDLEFEDPSSRKNVVILDFHQLRAPEISSLVRSLCSDEQRSGIRPIMGTQNPIYWETWFQNQGLGFRLDRIQRLPGFESSEWNQRFTQVRLLIEGLWSLVYEDGPGKSELANSILSRKPKATLSLSWDRRCLMLKLGTVIPGWNSHECIQRFWPDSSRPLGSPQLLTRYADAVRVVASPDQNEVELSLFLFPSDPARLHHHQLRTLWIESISSRWLHESVFPKEQEVPENFKRLPEVSVLSGQSSAAPEPTSLQRQGKRLTESQVQVQELKEQIEQRDRIIAELKSGGVGTIQRSLPPEGSVLIEALEDRVGESRHILRSLQSELEQAMESNSSPRQIEKIRHRLLAEKNRQADWEQSIAQILEQLKSSSTRAA